MRFVTLHDRKGKQMRIRPELIESVAVIDDDSTEISASSTFYEVSETPEEVLLIVEGADGTAAVVEAARRMIAWLDDSGATYAAHEAIVRDLRSALAAMEVPRG